MDIEATRSALAMKGLGNSKYELSKEEEEETAENNNLFSNGLSMRLINRKKIEFNQFKEAHSITKSQINSILQFNQKNEASSLVFLNNQLLSMESLLKALEEYKGNIVKEKISTMKNLEQLVGYAIKYSNKNVTVEEEIKTLSLSEKEIGEIQNNLLENINKKKQELQNILNIFDENLFNQAKSYLVQRLPIFWQVQEILIGILLQKERATTQEIQDAYSNYEMFMKLISGKNYENYSPISANNTFINIEAMSSEISKVEIPDNAELNKFLGKFINLIKLLCELAILSQNYKKNESHFLNMKPENNDGAVKTKKILLPEINLLIDQIKGFDSILIILDSNIQRKYKEIETINEFIKSLPTLYQRGLQKEITESFKQEVYKKQDINTDDPL